MKDVRTVFDATENQALGYEVQRLASQNFPPSVPHAITRLGAIQNYLNQNLELGKIELKNKIDTKFRKRAIAGAAGGLSLTGASVARALMGEGGNGIPAEFGIGFGLAAVATSVMLNRKARIAQSAAVDRVEFPEVSAISGYIEELSQKLPKDQTPPFNV